MNMNLFTRIFALVIISLSSVSCINEPLEIDPIAASELIQEESELFLYLTQVTADETVGSSVTCIDFIYSFNVYVYDEADEFVYAQGVSSDYEFWQFLQGISDEYSVGISFPIEAVLEDGSDFLIENKDQLAQAIQSCVTEIQEETLGTCNRTFVECGWVVTAIEGNEPDAYQDTVFETTDGNNLVYYKDGIGAPGTFIFYFIANQLHVNINFESSDETLEEHWNRDWIVTTLTETLISIENNGDRYDLIKRCPPEIYCTTLFFKVCEDEEGSDTANFIFEDYSYCIGLITGQPEETHRFDYFETLEDAEAFSNDLPQDGYTNIVNAQTIYVRITNIEDETWSITEITILAEFCEE